jgi:hypothetical protein
VPETPQDAAWWRGLTFALWLVFFMVGLVPELVYTVLREVGHVPTQRALINSPLAITVALAVYLALFVYRQCVETGMSSATAQTRSLQVGVLGLAAFLGMPQGGATTETVSLVQALLSYRLVADPTSRSALLISGLTKLAIWWYLLSLMMRYYLFGDTGVFVRMGSFLRFGEAGAPVDAAAEGVDEHEKDLRQDSSH